jgi:hypothetical protein
MHLRRHIILGAALAAFAAGAAQACPNHATHSSTAAMTATPNAVSPMRAAAVVAWKPRAWAPANLSSPQAQGLRVAIDPVDGVMSMPAADELSQQLVIGDDTPVQVDRAADGTLTAHLDDRWADFSVATLGPDGKPAWTCVQGRRGAAQFMKHPVGVLAPAAPKWEDK